MSKSKDVTEGAEPCAARRMREGRICQLSVIWLGGDD
jgi:hypothetical protein